MKVYEIKNGNGYIRESKPDGTLKFEGNYLDEEKNVNWDEFYNTFPEYCENYLIQEDNCKQHIYILKP